MKKLFIDELINLFNIGLDSSIFLCSNKSNARFLRLLKLYHRSISRKAEIQIKKDPFINKFILISNIFIWNEALLKGILFLHFHLNIVLEVEQFVHLLLQ